MRGQALVEFALVMPIFLFMVLGGGELAFLVAQQFSLQRGVDVLADAAAERIASNPTPGDEWLPKWREVAADENARLDCGDPTPAISYPDGGRNPGDRVRVTWHCSYQPKITTNLWGGLHLTMVGESVIRK